MRTTLGLLLGLLSTIACAEHYGAPITMKNPVTLEAAVKQLDGKSAAEVLVKSQVDEVCPQRRCWLVLKSNSSQLHVTFKDEAFFVPASLIGKTVLVQGKLAKGDPATAKGSEVHYELVASGIAVQPDAK